MCCSECRSERQGRPAALDQFASLTHAVLSITASLHEICQCHCEAYAADLEVSTESRCVSYDCIAEWGSTVNKFCSFTAGSTQVRLRSRFADAMQAKPHAYKRSIAPTGKSNKATICAVMQVCCEAHLELAVASVHHIDDTVHSETGFSNVGGHHHLTHALWRLLEDFALQIRRQLRVDRKDEQGRDPFTQMVQSLLWHNQNLLSRQVYCCNLHGT